MREIKFRAWDNQLKRFSEDGTICLNRCGHIFVLHNTEYTSIEQDTYTLLQYTGLKDKNGKEIYEGDIVKFNDIFSFPSQGVIAPIVWHEPTLRLIPQDTEENTRGGHYIHHWDSIQDIEVIGNIWENKELLENSGNRA